MKEFNTYLLDEWELNGYIKYKLNLITVKETKSDGCLLSSYPRNKFRLHTTEKLSLDYVNYYLYINLQQKLYYIQPNRLIIVFKNKTYKRETSRKF